MKIRPNHFFPGEAKPLSNAIGVVWRELATSVNTLVDAFNGTDASTGGNRWRGGVETTDDVVIDSDAGVILKSPDGHYWRVQVTNLGALTVTDLGTTLPVMFEYINPADLHKHWGFVRRGCEVVKLKTGEDWLPEDVYTAIKTNTAQLFMFPDGFCVLQNNKDAYNNENALHIWITWHGTRDDIKDAFHAELQKLAKSIGARKITFTSPRKWDVYSGAKVKSINYQIEVSP